MRVHVCGVHMYSWSMCGHMHDARVCGVNSKCLPLLFSTFFFKMEFLTEPGPHRMTSVAVQIFLPLSSRAARLEACATMSSFLCSYLRCELQSVCLPRKHFTH